jgi:hypothetical protein
VSGEISSDIAGVSVSMDEMSTSSSQVNLSAQELSKLSESLKQMVDQLLECRSSFASRLNLKSFASDSLRQMAFFCFIGTAPLSKSSNNREFRVPLKTGPELESANFKYPFHHIGTADRPS